MRPGNVNNHGFSLFEVMIAFTLFAVFAIAFVTGQRHNVETSVNLREELILQRLAKEKIDEIFLNPPQFQESLTMMPVEKNFEGSFQNYKYKIEYKRLKIPNLSMLQPKNEDEDNADEGQSAIEKKIYDEIQKYVEEAIWQVTVTVTNKQTKFFYTLSSWLSNINAKPKVAF